MLATQIEVSDGTLSIINVGIKFFEQDDISVSLDQSDLPLVLGVDYVWSAATTVTFLASPSIPGGLVPAGTEVIIRRDTKNDAMYNILDGGAPFSRLTLDENYKQLLYLTQEFSEGLGLDGLRNNLNMNGYKVVNVGTPTNAGDAANKGYVDNLHQFAIRTPEQVSVLPPAATRANKVMGFDASGNPIATLPATGSGTELAIDLANYLDALKGAGMVGYHRSALSIDIRTAAQMFDSNAVSVREKQFVDLITDRPNPADYTTWDWQPAIQGAINYVYNIAFAAQRINALPAVVLPGALYRCKSTITTYPWIKLASLGPVTLDFDAAAVNVGGVVIHNKVTWTQTGVNVSVSSALSPCLDGSRGAIYLRGQGVGTSTATAISVGNDVNGYDPVRDVQVCNVFANRWRSAVDFQAYDTYLTTFKSCRLEFNEYNIRTPLPPFQNSGERIAFIDCVLAGAGVASILSRGPGFDLHFLNTSLDFNEDVLRIDGGTYSSFHFTNCHFEGWDGAVVNCLTAASWCFVNMVSCTYLPTTYLSGVSGQNSAGRPMFITSGTGSPGNGVQINIMNPRIGVVQRCYSEEPFLSTGGGQVHIVGATMYERNFAGTAYTQGMRDWTFQKDADGTLATALTAWTFDNTNLITAPSSKLTTVSGKKVLQVTSSDSGSTSYFRLTAKDRTPVQPGQIVWAWAACSLSGTTGSANIQPNVQFYDSTGAALPDPPLYSSYVMRTAFNDATMPNYASGDTRYLSTEPMPYRAPPGAVSVAFRSLFATFGGVLNVSRASVWVSK